MLSVWCYHVRMSLSAYLKVLFVQFAVLGLTACSPATQVLHPTPSPAPSITRPASSPTNLPTAAQTFTPVLATPFPSPTATDALLVCAPLEGYTLAQLPSLVTNPFNPPAPGSDNPHQGVDLADRLPGSQAAVAGRSVRAFLAGRVAAVIADRFPYGIAVLLETALQDLPLDRFPTGSLPEPVAQALVNPALTCPPVQQPFPASDRRSIYILYAHLQTLPLVEVEQQVSCGQQIGNVGDSGNALNPHLHIETRLGPMGARFASLAHYDNRATPEEMGLYCLWRVSGIFRLLDPLVLLALAP